jgi:heptosyltransferase-2
MMRFWRGPAAGFALVAEALITEREAQVFLIGAEADREVTAEVARLCRRPLIDLTGQTSLRDWVRVMAAMDLVITNDSAPTHIASAVGAPVITLFGPTTPAQGFTAWAARAEVVEVEGLECRPCGRHGSRRCPEGHFKCMELLRPEGVIAAAHRLLGGEA